MFGYAIMFLDDAGLSVSATGLQEVVAHSFLQHLRPTPGLLENFSMKRLKISKRGLLPAAYVSWCALLMILVNRCVAGIL